MPAHQVGTAQTQASTQPLLPIRGPLEGSWGCMPPRGACLSFFLAVLLAGWLQDFASSEWGRMGS